MKTSNREMALEEGYVDRDNYIKKFKERHGEDYDYSLAVFSRVTDKIQIHCNKCGRDFQQVVRDHVRNNGCTYCSGKRKLTLDERVVNAKKKHGDKFDYAEWDVATAKDTGVVRCTKHDVKWKVSYDNHVNHGKECPSCRYEKSSKAITMNFDDALKLISSKFAHIHICEDSYTKWTTPCEHICKEHGSFVKSPQQVEGSVYGCTLCAEDNGKITSRPLTQDEFFGDIKDRLPHCDFTESIYTKPQNPVTFYCNTHKKHHTTRATHLKSKCKGCVDCSRESSSKNQIGFLNPTTVGRKKEEYLLQSNHLYVVKLEDLGVDVYKIGLARIPANRRWKLKYDFGEVTPIYIFKSNTYDTFQMEQNLHKHFTEKNYRPPALDNPNSTRKQGINEIFRLDAEDLCYIEAYVKEYIDERR